MRAVRKAGEGIDMAIPIGYLPVGGCPRGPVFRGIALEGPPHLNGEVLSWYGFPLLVTYQRSPAMMPTPVAIPV